MNIKSLEELAQYYDYGTIKLPGYASPMRVAIVKRVQEHEKYYSNNQGTLLPQIVLSRFGLTQNQNVKQVFYDVFNVGGLGLIARFYEVNGVKQPVRVFVLKK